MHTDSLRPDRRAALKAAGAAAVGALAVAPAAAFAADEPFKPKGNVNHSVCRWCYGKIPLEKLAEAALKDGYKSVELLSPAEVLKIKPLGMGCALLGGASIDRGLNREAFHPTILKQLREGIEFAADNGVPNVICMAGNRTIDNRGRPIDGKTVSDEEGLKTCAKGLKQVVGLAEAKKVTIVMEGLNSKVNHKDYMYDKTPWGVELCKKVGSPRFKLLYDIYHMQIMEGDVIATIKQYKDYIAHYHTGGVPGRHEIDETQELNYPAIMRAILATGYQGYVAQEFIPARDPLTSLAQGLRICDV
jgi:hydroxypyruvate isomerase